MKSFKNFLLLCAVILLAGCASTTPFLVTSEPAGAAIFVDGEQVGKTPATINVTFTQNEQLVTENKILSVALPGYKEAKEVLSGDEGGQRTFNLKLMPETTQNKPALKSTEAHAPTVRPALESIQSSSSLATGTTVTAVKTGTTNTTGTIGTTGAPVKTGTTTTTGKTSTAVKTGMTISTAVKTGTTGTTKK